MNRQQILKLVKVHVKDVASGKASKSGLDLAQSLHISSAELKQLGIIARSFVRWIDDEDSGSLSEASKAWYKLSAGAKQIFIALFASTQPKTLCYAAPVKTSTSKVIARSSRSSILNWAGSLTAKIFNTPNDWRMGLLATAIPSKSVIYYACRENYFEAFVEIVEGKQNVHPTIVEFKKLYWSMDEYMSEHEAITVCPSKVNCKCFNIAGSNTWKEAWAKYQETLK